MGRHDDKLAFEGGTAFLLARTGALARQRWARMLAERGLTPHHYGMLMALHEKGSLGQQQLSTLIGIDARNAVTLIDGLVERGLLDREVDPDDRRRRVLTLTAVGKHTVGDLIETGTELERRFLAPLSRADQKELRRMLHALFAEHGSP